MDVARERGLGHLEGLGLLDFLRVRREEMHLSQEEASRRIGLASLAHYGHFERGTREVQIEYIRPIAFMLEVPPGLILEKYLRHRYGAGEDRWLVDELYGPDLAIAHKVKRLSEEEKKGIAMMVDLFLTKNR